MKSIITIVSCFIGLGLLCLVIATANAANVKKKKDNLSKLEQYQQMDWSQYSLTALKNKLPKKFYGLDVSLLPVQSLYFLPTANLTEMHRAWKATETQWPQAILIANGIYNLEQIERLISDSAVLKKINNKTYISYRPIYVAPTATLVINAKELRLSLVDGVFVFVNGKLFVVDSVVTSWDEDAENYGIRDNISKKELLFYEKQFPRPYLLGLSGSEIYAGNSVFRGLGYKGRIGTFGFAMNKGSPAKSGKKITSSLRRRKKPTGWLIGNTFEQNLYGYYSKNAKDAVIVGNVYLNNIIYNIDSHDYSENLLIARNLSYSAKYSHGIVISREVNHTTIAENLSLKNFGTGIKLDRNCKNNFIYNNMVLENHGDGIAIVESDNNILLNNTVARNDHNGVYVRNSCNIKLQSNYLFRNVVSGAEISVVNIDYLATRNFLQDPYHQSANAQFIDNTFDSNLGSAISSKNKSGVLLKGNLYHNSGVSYFADDLEAYNSEILSSPFDKEFLYKGINECH